ncbi:MAG: porin family protein [Sphingomonas sp.]|jgi:outer membrane immunogenic protein|uniref:outer membrane protein n=1 Tax=Sphingomonas sp. TaxID=28214 RepID=UPI0035698254
MRLFAAAILLSAFGATSAMAQESSDKPFQGATVTAIAGIDASSAAGQNETGFLYGGQLGYDWQRGKTVFGVEAEIDGATSKKCYDDTFVAGDRSCGKAGRDLYVGGRIGRVVGDTTLLYVKAGYANARSTVTYEDGGTGAGNLSESVNRDGVRGGVGVEKAIGRNLLVKAEYRYSNYADGYSRNQGVAGIGFRF